MAQPKNVIRDEYALYLGDCIEVMKSLPEASVGLSVYSPPFGGLYCYSSSPQDMSNSTSYGGFLEHYEFAVIEKTRLTKPGRLSVVHCMDVPRGAHKGLRDFPGDLVRLHEKHGWQFHDRKFIWKEPLKAAIRTRALGLRHGQLVKDSTVCHSAHADQLIVMKRAGKNAEPVTHPTGLSAYAGDWQAPPRPRAGCEFDLRELQAKYVDWEDQGTNKLSHWIWQRYASAFWDDIRINRVLPYKQARDPEDEKHVHPLQLDTIDRCLVLWSNPGDVVLDPFAGVGSTPFAAVAMGRPGLGIELKPTYFRQMAQNVAAALKDWKTSEDDQFLLRWDDDDLEEENGLLPE